MPKTPDGWKLTDDYEKETDAYAKLFDEVLESKKVGKEQKKKVSIKKSKKPKKVGGAA